MLLLQAIPGFRMLIAAAVVLALPFAATAASTAADRCEVSKNKTAGTYYLCREKAEATAILRGLPADYSRCTTKFEDKWDSAESTGAGACPDNVELTEDMEAFISAQAAEAASIIEGAEIPACGANLSTACATLDTVEGELAACYSRCSLSGGVGGGPACWYLGALGQSCDTVCASHGLTYDEATDTYAGRNGTLAHCAAVLAALPLPPAGPCSTTWNTPTYSVGVGAGIGCYWTSSDFCPDTYNWFKFRDVDADTTAAATLYDAARACACD